jgi:hypothetical protein
MVDVRDVPGILTDAPLQKLRTTADGVGASNGIIRFLTMSGRVLKIAWIIRGEMLLLVKDQHVVSGIKYTGTLFTVFKVKLSRNLFTSAQDTSLIQRWDTPLFLGHANTHQSKS